MSQSSKYNKIIYFPLSAFLHGIAYLPFWVLYRISDVIFVLIYYIFRYRRKVVIKNINECFPEKSEKERKKIVWDFYRHFVDTFVETIKLLHVSDEEMHRRIVFKDIHVLDKSVANGRSVIMYAAHFCNWEWLSAITQWTKEGPDVIQFGQVYHPLENQWFDEFFLNLRGRFNSYSYPMKRVVRDLLAAKSNKKISVTGFIADQHPHPNDQDDVITFLNHYTAFITGAEVLAKKMDMDVLFFDVYKIKRGYYECTVREITRTPKETEQYEITNTYARLLEKAILKQPHVWLWTHKRWKRPVTPKNIIEND